MYCADKYRFCSLTLTNVYSSFDETTLVHYFIRLRILFVLSFRIWPCFHICGTFNRMTTKPGLDCKLDGILPCNLNHSWLIWCVLYIYSKDAMEKQMTCCADRLHSFILRPQTLGAGGILAASEWIYWESLGMIIGTFGKVALSVHTIPTQVIMVTFMPGMGLGVALAIRLGATLPLSVPRAKRITRDCYLLAILVLGTCSMIMYTCRYTIYSWFTQSEAVIAGCDEIWWKVCFYFFQLSIFGVHMGSCIGLGMQWTLGVVTLVVLWIFGLPAAFFVSVTLHGGLNGAWSAIWPPYVVINLILSVAILRADWDAIAEQIRVREGMELIDTKHKENGKVSLIVESTYGSLQKSR